MKKKRLEKKVNRVKCFYEKMYWGYLCLTTKKCKINHKWIIYLIENIKIVLTKKARFQITSQYLCIASHIVDMYSIIWSAILLEKDMGFFFHLISFYSLGAASWLLSFFFFFFFHTFPLWLLCNWWKHNYFRLRVINF